jgi:hypothetical protein
MRVSGLRMRLWTASMIIGLVISCVLSGVMWKTHAGFWLPGSQPGWLFAWIAMAVIRTGSESDRLGGALTTIGNAAFYAWLTRGLLAAEITVRGALGKHFLGHRRTPAPRF